MGERRAQLLQSGEVPDPDQTGLFTTAIVSNTELGTVALFYAGSKHAGENLNKLLTARDSECGAHRPAYDATRHAGVSLADAGGWGSCSELQRTAALGLSGGNPVCAVRRSTTPPSPATFGCRISFDPRLACSPPQVERSAPSSLSHHSRARRGRLARATYASDGFARGVANRESACEATRKHS